MLLFCPSHQVNHQVGSRNTSTLLVAAKYGSSEVIKLLLSYGAEVETVNLSSLSIPYQYFSPLQVLCKTINMPEIVSESLIYYLWCLCLHFTPLFKF